MSMSDRITIAVIGADTAVGAEIARLGVAIDYEVIGYADDGPPTDEPWTHGVTWHQRPSAWRPDRLDGVDAVVIADPAQITPELRAIAEDRAIRLVGILSAGEPTPRAHEVFLAPGAFAPAAEVMAANAGGLFLEHVAMAALRCSVEDDRKGIYGPEDIAYIGDAVMIQ